jgi:hypothetical protein
LWQPFQLPTFVKGSSYVLFGCFTPKSSNAIRIRAGSNGRHNHGYYIGLALPNSKKCTSLSASIKFSNITPQLHLVNQSIHAGGTSAVIRVRLGHLGVYLSDLPRAGQSLPLLLQPHSKLHRQGPGGADLALFSCGGGGIAEPHFFSHMPSCAAHI